MLGHTVDNTSVDQQEREWWTGSAVVSILFVMLGHTTADKTTVIGSCIWARSSVGQWKEQLPTEIDSGAMIWCRLCFSCCSCWEGGRKKNHSCHCIIKTEKRREEGFFQGSCLREEKNGAPVQLLLFSRLCSCTLPLRCVSVCFLLVEDPFSCSGPLCGASFSRLVPPLPD